MSQLGHLLLYLHYLLKKSLYPATPCSVARGLGAAQTEEKMCPGLFFLFFGGGFLGTFGDG